MFATMRHSLAFNRLGFHTVASFVITKMFVSKLIIVINVQDIVQ